ncbi:uncharacterized protein F54H12.2-like [Clytia hemisphaerica]|uniref:uncharacterized protein F54H12.2-like n=1 Tax=Clytia hemisphaerica TaxID=252671 RepID=UPI0034D604AF
MESKDKSHIECALSDTDLFTPAFVQSDIQSGTFEEIYPITKLEDNGPLEFSIKNATDMFIDFANTYLRIKVRLLKGDGTLHAVTDKASFVNYPIASLFSQLDVYLGGTLVRSSNNTYAYRSIIETLLNYGPDAKESQFEMGLFSKDTAGELDETDPAKDNEGLKTRASYTNESKTIELIGRLHTDLCNQGRLLLNGLPLRLVFHRNNDQFSIMATANNPKVKITDAVLCIRKVELTHHKFVEIQKHLEKNVASYPINRVLVKTHSIAAGLTSLNWDNLILGQLSNRIFLGMIDNDSYTGNYKKNPFNFKHFDVRDVAVYVNGKTLSHPMKLNFTDGEYLEGYRSLFTATGKINRDEGMGISRRDYPNGYSLFGFDLSAALCNGPHQEPTQEGSLRITLEFARALPNTISVIVYAEFDNLIKVNKVRNVLKDF